jgi:hypothetical protein
MESLGFIDPPDQSWTVSPSLPAPATSPPSATTQTTELYEIPTGKHTKRVEPTGELIKDIWDSTELHAPSLLDWAPESFSATKLGRRSWRWPVVISVMVVVLSVAAFGYWLYGRADSQTSIALSVVTEQALHLDEMFDRSEPLIRDLDAERLPEANQDSTVFFDIGEAARAMFAASADLPESDTSDRTAAAEAASLAIDASRRLMDATAYRTALEPALTLPLFETDPALTDLTTATAAFTEWRSGFENILDALPSEMTGLTSAALGDVSGKLETVQSAYLDAMRLGDRAVAVEAIGGLKADLLQVRAAMIADLGDLATAVDGLIEQARSRLAPLLG